MEKQADNRRTSRSWSNQQGAVLVFFVLLLPILFVFMGLVIDVGIAYHERRTMQTAADAGAIAGAREVQKENVGQITPAVLTDAALNGYDSNNGADITVNSPPQNGHKAGDEAFVEVIIRQAVPTYLMRLLNFDLVDVSTRAVAGVGPPDNCIWVLDPDAEKTLNVESGASVEVGCGIQVDSNSSIAISITSGSYVEATSIKIVGGYEATSGSSVDPTPDTGVSPVSDPMAEMSAPTYGACDYFDTLVDGGSATLYPGVYCGNPAIKINSANVTFMPEDTNERFVQGVRRQIGIARQSGEISKESLSMLLIELGHVHRQNARRKPKRGRGKEKPPSNESL